MSVSKKLDHLNCRILLLCGSQKKIASLGDRQTSSKANTNGTEHTYSQYQKPGNIRIKDEAMWSGLPPLSPSLIIQDKMHPINPGRRLQVTVRETPYHRRTVQCNLGSSTTEFVRPANSRVKRDKKNKPDGLVAHPKLTSRERPPALSPSDLINDLDST